MVSSNSDKICIRRGKSFKGNNPLHHVGAQYRDDQNEKHSQNDFRASTCLKAG